MKHKSEEKEFVWQAPARPYQKRNRDYYVTVFLLAFLLIIIAFFIKEWLIIGVVLAIMFVSYILAAVSPDTVEHKITTHGIWAGGTFYKHKEIHHFWFENQLKSTILVLELKKTHAHILLVIPPGEKSKITALLKKSIRKREKPLKSFVDIVSSWLSRTVPLEDVGTSSKNTSN